MIYSKLAKFQSQAPSIKKDKYNKHLKYYYASLESVIGAVRPVLNKCGLSFNHEYRVINEEEYLVCVLFETGENETGKIESYKKIDKVENAKNIYWESGNADTYYRRYTLQSLLGLQAEDDDGNKASKPAKPINYDRQKEALKACKNKSEVREFYDRLSPTEKTSLKTLVTEFALTLEG